MYAQNSYAAADGGLLAISQPRHHTVLLFDATRSPPELRHVVGSQGDAAGQLLRPTGVAISAARGVIAVSDAGNHRIQLFRLERSGDRIQRVSFAKSAGRRGSAPGELDGPEGLAFDREGNLYVSDTGNARIQVWDAQLRFVRQWGERGAGEGQLALPLSIAVSAAGDRVYVADGGNLRVHVFDRDGLWRGAWGAAAPAGKPGTFAYPFGLAVAADGAVYVTDSRRQTVQQFSAGGDFVREWGGPGQEPGHFFQPEGIAADAQGRLVVVDYGSHRGQTFSPTGEMLGHFSIPPGDLIPPALSTPPAGP